MSEAAVEAGEEQAVRVVAASRWRYELEGLSGRWWYEVVLEGARGARYEVSLVHPDGTRPLPFKVVRSGRTTRALGRSGGALRRALEETARSFVAGCAPAVVYGREKHAAHTGGGTGWDLDRWTYAQPNRLPIPAGVPGDAEYNHGFRDDAGVQCWVYYRKAPLSPERCAYCPPA